MMRLSIDAARQEDEDACFALLPQVFGLESDLLVARDAGIIVGAASIQWESWRSPHGFPLLVHVLPDARRRGIGRALVAAARRRIAGEGDGLWTRRPIREDSEVAAFLTACGFIPRDRQFRFEVNSARFLAHVGRIAGTMRARGRVARGARIISLTQAVDEGVDLAELAMIVSGEFRSSPGSLAVTLRADGAAGFAAMDAAASTVALEGERLAGALLVRQEQGTAVIQANVVAPAWRRGWANVLLLEGSTALGVEQGLETFQFYCDQHNRDSMNLAKRASATLVAAEVSFYQAASGSA